MCKFPSKLPMGDLEHDGIFFLCFDYTKGSTTSSSTYNMKKCTDFKFFVTRFFPWTFLKCITIL